MSRADQIKIGLVIPESGPSGIFGPSCAASAQLAVEEINSRGGILGREVVVSTIDGGTEPVTVANRVRTLCHEQAIDAVVGWHTSAVRLRVAAAIRGQIPYIYTALYEGGESTPGVFLTGEIPDKQVVPALNWMATHHRVRRWYVVGSDYVWPHETLSQIIDRCVDGTHSTTSTEIVLAGARFLPLGASNFDDVLDAIETSSVDGVLVLLLGQDAVRFNRAFGERGLHRDIVRLSPLMDENMLLATGAENALELYSASGYFESLATGHSMDFANSYFGMHGMSAPPLASPGESCYEGISLLDKLAHQAKALDVGALVHTADTIPIDYESPRGMVRFVDNHLAQDVYIAHADGLDFDVDARVAEVV
ncbi:substrate-binding domain-containing protein [Rhodococcus pyridinivorans]|uniref:substrate-binding domain-containing protein n=1 Tax=Rhodococcus pyridinivorans TaxID=103816 RepID=UPI0036BC95AD